MYYWKVWLWENGRKAAEYSDYTLAPVFIEDRLDETLDTAEIILESMPIATKKAFPPKTKFRIERFNNTECTGEPKTWDFVVEHDDVEEYPGCPDICCHRIHLIEPSVVAQGMHVDNIALTYELQDVDLNYQSRLDLSAKVTPTVKNVLPTAIFTREDSNTDFMNYMQYTNQKLPVYKRSFGYTWDESSLNSLRNLPEMCDGSEETTFSFTVPKLMFRFARCNPYDNSLIEYNYTDTYQYELNTVTTVTEKVYENYEGFDNLIREREIESFESGATSFRPTDDVDFKFTSDEGNFTPFQYFDAYNLIDLLHNTGNKYDLYLYTYAQREPNFFSTGPRNGSNVKFAEAKSNYTKTFSFTTRTLAEGESKIEYVIKCAPKAEFLSNFISMTKATAGRAQSYIDGRELNYIQVMTENTNVNPDALSVTATVTCGDAYYNADPIQYLKKGVQYNCYDMLRKALLTVDTYLIDTVDPDAPGLDDLWSEFPIVIHDTELIGRLKNVQMHETTFESKNLWEVLLQIGYYIHAIPYLEFAVDNTDRFELKYRQLGGTKMPNDDSVKITVFNSRNLSEYFTQYDSYVTNLYSPQNVVEEYLPVKTSSEDFLVSNDTAELHTVKPIFEILDFKLHYNDGVGLNALSHIFEKTVYDLLSNGSPARIRPAKGNSIYYTLGDNKIKGLSYVAPQANSGSNATALANICMLLKIHIPFGMPFGTCLHFYIKYRSQDTARITQIRPDIQNFIRNSAYEKYPHHEQFYGQQDKIVDSERFSANLFGRLIRVGNGIYQRQEYVESGDGKESGDLVEIDDEPYYVTAVENEGYADGIFQKVTYSKNFNQLSQICTIPSEPRFYEVSERGIIRREIRTQDFLELTTEKRNQVGEPRFLNNSNWRAFVINLLFKKERDTDLPNYAYVMFCADEKREHKRSDGEPIPTHTLFPSSEVIYSDNNIVTPVRSGSLSQCIVPIMHFPMHDSIVFEWDMEDNFKAGDCVVNSHYVKNGAYHTMQAVRYCDVLGRADLFYFKLFHKTGLQRNETYALPGIPYGFLPSDRECPILTPTGKAVALEKDCREALSFNYQIHLLHRPRPEDKEDFITFPNLFGRKASDLQLCFLRNPQNLFAENADFSPGNVLAQGIDVEIVEAENGAIEIQIPRPENIELGEVKALVLYEVSEGKKHACIAKNVAKLPNDLKLNNWYICPVFGM